MNNKQRIIRRTEIYKKYHIPSMPNYARRKVNAIFLNPANSLKHELKKCEICYELQSNGNKFITEAVRNQVDSNGKN